MNVSKIINNLTSSDNYIKDRNKLTSDFINVIRDNYPDDYEKIKVKEEKYLEAMSLLKELKKELK
jgi:hypothetical protein